jgi:uncharacterized membrane protein YraQ (UPF0718 family)
MKMSKKKKYIGFYFLGFAILIYGIIGVFNFDLIMRSLIFFIEIFKKVLPVFFLIFIFNFVLNFFITQKQINNYIGKSSGYKKWFIAIIAGILSAGPIFMWYPVLKDLQKKGVSHGFIATFIYNRAIKLAPLPIFIYYFDWKYTLIFSTVLIIFSLIQGFIFDKLFKI